MNETGNQCAVENEGMACTYALFEGYGPAERVEIEYGILVAGIIMFFRVVLSQRSLSVAPERYVAI